MNNVKKIVEVAPGILKPAEYNPRQMTADQVKNLTASIKKFGLVDPFIVNEHKGRENVVIGGHQRLKIALLEGFETVPVVYVDLTRKDEEELNLRLNKNNGEWDWDLLANFEMDMLEEIGFEKDELLEKFGIDSAESEEVPLDRLEVLTVNPPESPRLKERAAFHCDTMEEYELIVDGFKTGTEGKLDKDKLISLV